MNIFPSSFFMQKSRVKYDFWYILMSGCCLEDVVGFFEPEYFNIIGNGGVLFAPLKIFLIINFER